MSRITLTLFGPPRLEREGVPVHLRSRKCIALLAYLAVTGRTHTRPELSALFWPESDTPRAQGSLRHTLSLLRQGLRGEWLVSDHSTVGLDHRHMQAVDVVRFRGLLGECHAHDHIIDEPCPKRLSLLDEAVELYQGDFFSGFTLRDSPAFDDWQSQEAEALRREMADALERLAQGNVAEGYIDRAINYAQRWLALDSLNEAAHRSVMRLYAQCGRRSEALLQYEACAQLLEEQLGVPPDPETTALSQAIRETRLSYPSDGVPAVAASLVITRHNLPAQPTPFIGRQGELAQIAQLLRDPACRLLTVLGPGGIGKTRVAIQAAQEQLRFFDHGVRFVSLAALNSADLLASSIMEALDATSYGSGEPRQRLLSYLANKKLLLILDNFEHLLEGASLVAEMLIAAHRLKVLVTSRERLSLREEWLMPLEGMQFPQPDDVDDAREEDYSALQLFAQCARRFQPDYSLASAEPDSVARICRLVEGMPLAIELAAPWIQAMSCRDIVQEIEHDLNFLATTLRDMPPRHRSMQAVFDRSWQLLTTEEKSMLRKLSVFRGGFRSEAAEAVTGASLSALSALIGKSWLRSAPAGRYGVHELVRQYCDERLGQDPEQWRQAHNHHSEYYASFLDEREIRLKGRGQQNALQEIVADMDNIRAAWAWAVEWGDVRTLGRSVESLCLVSQRRSWYRETEQALDSAATNIRKVRFVGGSDQSAVSPEEAGVILLQVLSWQAFQRYRFGSVRSSLALLEEGLDLLREAERGRRQRGATARAKLLRAKVLVAVLLSWVGTDRQRADVLLHDALSDASRVDDEWSTILGAWCLGQSAFRRGEYPSAEHWLQRAIEVVDRSGDLFHRPWCTGVLSMVFCATGRYRSAESLAESARQLSERIGDQVGACASLVWLGRIAAAQGNHDLARRHYENSLGLSREMGDPLFQFDALIGQAQIASALQHEEKAAELLQQTLAMANEVDPYRHLQTAVGLGHTALSTGDLGRSLECFREALAIAADTGFRPGAIDALVGIARLAAREGNQRRAATLLALVLHHPATTQVTKDRAQEILAQVSGDLPPEALSTALERGQARELEEVLAEILIERT